MSMRIGVGFDSHVFQAGIPLIIGGLAIEHSEGLAGHSDGDVLLHAITDALLGVKPGEVGIKAKTPEGLGLEHTAVAHCTVLLESLQAPDALAHMAATAEAGSEEELNAVVEGLIGGRHDLSALGRKKPFDTDDLT